MPRLDPPIATRFPVNRQNHTQKHPNGYLTCILKKVLLKQYRCQNPETGRIKKMLGAQGLMQVWVWEGLQGNEKAIKDIVDRIDGKIPDTIIDQSVHQHYVIFRNPEAIKENASDIRPRKKQDAQLPAR